MYRFRSFLVISITLLLTSPIWSATPNHASGGRPVDAQAIEDRILRFTNVERERLGRPVLAMDVMLTHAARQNSGELLRGGFVDRTDVDPAFLDVDDPGCLYTEVGKNVACYKGYPFDRVAQDAVADWMHCVRSRANILSFQFTFVGIGVVTGHDTVTATAYFARHVEQAADR